VRVAAKDVPVAYSPILEHETLPQVADIAAAIRSVRSY